MADFVLQDEVFYHGTRARFERFRPLSHFGSLDAATDILATSSTIKNEKLDGLTDITKTNKSSTDTTPDSIIIPAKLNLTNTYEIQDFATCHDLKSYKGFILYHIAHDLGIDGTPDFFDYIFNNPFNMPHQDVITEINRETLYTPKFEGIDRYHLAFQRIIQYFESLGYDGFHYINQYEDRGSVSYIVFRPENVNRMDIKTQNSTQTTHQSFVPKLLPVRDKTNDERVRLYAENIHNDDLFEHKISRTQNLNNPIHTDKIKAHYAKIFYNDILPKIKKISHQPEFGYHGISHTEQTALIGLDIAITCACDPMPVILACALHDICRQDNTIDPHHGAHAVPFVRNFLNKNFPRLHRATVQEIVNAVKNHNNGNIAKQDLTSACMWDADRIRIAWNNKYCPEYFSTAYGKHLAEMSGQRRAEYISAQEQFLVEHGLKTPEQIRHEAQMNKIAIQREFNIKYR